jgi:N-acetylmuramoyl-L-alanine amidase
MDVGLPVANSVISGTITLVGWAFDNVGISGIQILLDDVVIGSPTLGFARPDIPIAFPGAPANSGIEFAFDSSKFPNGPHVISTVVSNTSGITTTMQSQITINQASDVITPQGPLTLDTPSANSTIVGTTNISGWAFDNVAITKVNILLDGGLIGSATLGLSRPDIKAGLIGAPTNSGFNFTFNSASFPNGAHVISYVAYDLAGNTKQGNTQITIAN